MQFSCPSVCLSICLWTQFCPELHLLNHSHSVTKICSMTIRWLGVYSRSVIALVKIVLLRSYLGSAQAHPILHRNKEGNHVTNHKGQSIHILHVASSSEPLYKILELYPFGSCLGSAGMHPILQRNKEGNLLKSTFDKP